MSSLSLHLKPLLLRWQPQCLVITRHSLLLPADELFGAYFLVNFLLCQTNTLLQHEFSCLLKRLDFLERCELVFVQSEKKWA